MPRRTPSLFGPLSTPSSTSSRNEYLDKPTLDQFQRILAAVSKTPAAFDEDTQKAVSRLKSIVSSMPSGGTDTSQVATEITDRIIALGEKLNQQLKSAGGAIDIVLKPEPKLKKDTTNSTQ